MNLRRRWILQLETRTPEDEKEYHKEELPGNDGNWGSLVKTRDCEREVMVFWKWDELGRDKFLFVAECKRSNPKYSDAAN